MKYAFFSRLLPFAAVTAFSLAALPASASIYNSLVVFGDSLSDSGNNAVVIGSNAGQAISGNTYVPSFPYGSGVYSNGPVWASNAASTTRRNAAAFTAWRNELRVWGRDRVQSATAFLSACSPRPTSTWPPTPSPPMRFTSSPAVAMMPERRLAASQGARRARDQPCRQRQLNTQPTSAPWWTHFKRQARNTSSSGTRQISGWRRLLRRQALPDWARSSLTSMNAALAAELTGEIRRNEL